MVKNTKNNLRVPPQNIDSERAVLGSIMLRKDAMHEIEDVLTSDSFYAEKHKIIFQTMLDLSMKNEPIDVLSLSAKLGEQKLLNNIGGNQYLAEIVNIVPSSTSIKHYATIVQKKYILRGKTHDNKALGCHFLAITSWLVSFYLYNRSAQLPAVDQVGVRLGLINCFCRGKIFFSIFD